MRRSLIAMMAAVLPAGCSSTLETGYMPRKLGSSDETRRGFYAQPFTPQAKAAKQYELDYEGGRQKPGY